MTEVGAWLRGLGLGEYEPAFRANRVDAAVLPSLTAEDLKVLAQTPIVACGISAAAQVSTVLRIPSVGRCGRRPPGLLRGESGLVRRGEEVSKTSPGSPAPARWASM